MQMYADVYAILIANWLSTFCIVKKKIIKEMFSEKETESKFKSKIFSKISLNTDKIPWKFLIFKE